MQSYSRRREAPSSEEPSRPTPCSSAESSSDTGIEKLLSSPSTSTNQRRTKRTPRSSTVRSTNSLWPLITCWTVWTARGPVFIHPVGTRSHFGPVVHTPFTQQRRDRHEAGGRAGLRCRRNDYCDDARRAPEAGGAGCRMAAEARCGERRLISVTVVSMLFMTQRVRRAVPSARQV